jgi:predicted aspartyl protease
MGRRGELLRLDRRALLSQAAWLAGGLASVWLLREKVLWPTPSVEAPPAPAWLPFASRRDVATVEVEARGLRFPALIDTGAQRTALDRTFADRLGLNGRFPLPMLAYGVSGQPQLGSGVRLDLAVGDLAARGLTAAVLELGPIAGAQGLSTPLIIGQDVLQAAVAEIDYPGRRLRLLRAESYAPPPRSVTAPSRRRGKALWATVGLDGAPVEGLVDTGASGALSLMSTLPVVAGLPPASRTERAVVLGGVMESAVVEGRTVTFAGETFRDLEVHVHGDVGLPGLPDVIIGAELLARNAVSLDLSRGRLAVIGTA